MKEDFWLRGAEKFVYILAPVIAAFSAFMIYVVIPFGSQVSILGHSTPLQLTDFPVAALYDSDLITVAGLRAIRQAEVIVHDRLAPAALLDEAPAAAERIAVGKIPL